MPRLLGALGALERPIGTVLHLCLLLDGCTDDSAGIAARYRGRDAVHVVEKSSAEPNAGLARDAAMRIGVEALGASGGILLTTDADSWPRPDWLTTMIAALDHADIVAGDIARDGGRTSPDQDRIDGYYDRLFAMRRTIDPVVWEAPVTHHHGSGANMGMRTETYVALGGFAPLAHGEDARLIDDAERAGLRVRRDASSVVHTSDRRHGRARHGLADALRQLDRDGLASIMVAHPADQSWQYRAHALARRQFASGVFGELGDMIGLDADHVLGVARDCPNAQAFAMRVVPVPPDGMRYVPFPLAEAALAASTIADTTVRAA